MYTWDMTDQNRIVYVKDGHPLGHVETTKSPVMETYVGFIYDVNGDRSKRYGMQADAMKWVEREHVKLDEVN